jgi:hypothetical protein
MTLASMGHATHTGALYLVLLTVACSTPGKRASEAPSISPSEPECYALAYTDPIRDASARLFPVWVALLPGYQSGALIGHPNPAFGDESWRAMTESTGWKRIAADSLELVFGGRSEAISIHVARSGSKLSGRATWVSDVVEQGPKPSMRVEGTRESCPPPQEAWAQTAAPPGDSDLRDVIAIIAAQRPRAVRASSEAMGRIEGDGLALHRDSVILTTASGFRAIAIKDVDSVWTQRGTAAQLVGIIAALPCAIYGGLVGSFIGGDPDSNGSPGRQAGLTIAGFAGGAVICGSIGAAVGSTIRRWQLEFARAAT